MAAKFPSLGMSKTKIDLLDHLNMPPETYAQMAKETDQVYRWLTQDKHHLKSNCKRKPPYDWSDFDERSKDSAMDRIAKSGDAYTSYYWNLGETDDPNEPNWLAKWFLYHKFRYRDGRNRNINKNDDARDSNHGSRHSRPDHSTSPRDSGSHSDPYTSSHYNPPSSGSSSSSYQQYYSTGASTSSSYTTHDPSTYSYAQSDGATEQNGDLQGSKGFYDPVRDSNTP